MHAWSISVERQRRAGYASCLSFESTNFPGGFLRRQGDAVRQDQSDGTSQFNADATFCAVPGVSGSGTSLRAYADPTSFLRHYNGDLYTASNGGADPWDTTTSWADDATWTPTPSWSS